MAATITSTLCAHPWRDGQAELASIAWLNTKTIHQEQLAIPVQYWPKLDAELLLMCKMLLPLSQTVTLVCTNYCCILCIFSSRVSHQHNIGLQWSDVVWQLPIGRPSRHLQPAVHQAFTFCRSIYQQAVVMGFCLFICHAILSWRGLALSSHSSPIHQPHHSRRQILWWNFRSTGTSNRYAIWQICNFPSEMFFL